MQQNDEDIPPVFSNFADDDEYEAMVEAKKKKNDRLKLNNLCIDDFTFESENWYRKNIWNKPYETIIQNIQKGSYLLENVAKLLKKLSAFSETHEEQLVFINKFLYRRPCSYRRNQIDHNW